jgi:membrane protease subunit (stomatin/prohibitin family)
VSLISFLHKQFIGVVQWNEPEDGILAYRYPMQELEIQTDGQLTVRESQMALFVHQGKIADIFGPGLHTLAPRNLPLLAGMMHWDRQTEASFKAEVYFFSTRRQNGQKWDTGSPITIRDREFGAVRLRCSGSYGYRIADPALFFTQVSGAQLGEMRECCFSSDLEGQLRDTILAHMTGVFANSGLPFLDLAANKQLLAGEIVERTRPMFAALGLELSQVTVEQIVLPEELSRALEERLTKKMVASATAYAQYAAAESVVLGGSVSAAMPRTMATAAAATPAAKLCIDCGQPLAPRSRVCAECGQIQ